MQRKKSLRLLAALLAVALCLTGVKYAKKYIRDITFYWRERSETELRVKAYADEMGIAYSEYPESLIELLERNPETEEFVLGYPFREEMEPDLSNFDRSNGVPLFLQWDPRWGYGRYGSDMIAITGCGPTCLAMAGYYLTGDEAFTPDAVAAYAEKNGYYSPGSGSSWTLISEGGVKLGLTVTELPLVKSKMVKQLEAGNPIICSMRAGDFTTSGHYIVLTGLEDGKFRVNDPNSRVNSEKLWSYEDIEGQIRNLWAVTA